MYVLFSGVVTSGFQFASGEAVGRAAGRSPFPAGTLLMQQPHFKARGLDLEEAVPGLYWGTINIEIEREVVLVEADHTFRDVDWTEGTAGKRIPPETFSLVRCCLATDGRYHAGLIYYPHPETKPETNRHRFDVLEVLTHKVPDISQGKPATLMFRSDAFRPR